MRAWANPTRSSMRERTRRPPALGCALASRIQAAMTAAHVTKFLFACVSWLVLALPMQAAAADPCPLLRAQAGSPVVASRIAAAACEEHQLWYRPFIDLRSEEHTSELQSLMRNSYAVFCLQKNNLNITSFT